MKKSVFLHLNLVLLFFVLVSSSLVAESIDQSKVKIGILTDHEFTTLRAQSFSGNWKATFYPPTASESERLVPPAAQTIANAFIVEGEDMAISLSRKGVVGKLSTGREINAGFGKVVLSGGELISLDVPGSPPVILHGDIEIYINENFLNMFNTLTMHQYLVSSVSKFANSSEIEALKAFIIMARTRTSYLRENPSHPDHPYHVCDLEHCIEFSGAGQNRELIDILVGMTANKIVTYKDKVIFPRFHNTCGGKISSAKDLLNLDNEPYHVTQEDRIDNQGSENCFHSPGFHWSIEIPKLEILEFLSITWAGGADRIFTGWDPSAIDATGRISKVVLRGRRPREISGLEFFDQAHEYFGPNSLKSMRFSMEVLRRSVIFRGMGQGDGIGLCLYGADGMAKKGKKYHEILGFYYPGTAIK